jgi:hypothetical protein
MPQATGANARLSWKKEITAGVPNFPVVGGGGDTTLSVATSPGATSITVASATNIAAGDIIRVGDDYNPEYVQVLSVAGQVITLESNTPVNFRHEIGEIVKEVTISGFKKIAGFVSVDTLGDIAKIVSQELTGQRGTPKSRPGNVSVDFNMVAELGIEQSGIWFRYILGKTGDYFTTGTTVGGGGSTTTNAGVSAGGTTLPLTALTNFNAGDFVEVDTGSLAEVVKISASWNGTDNPVPLDASYPFRKAHNSGVAAVEKQSPFTSVFKRGASLDSLTMLLHLTDINSLALVKGAKINTLAATFTPGDETIKLTMAINAQSLQIIQKDIFGTPSSISHKFYAPWEIKIKQDAVIINIVESFNFTINNAIDAGRGRTIGSRFKTSITPGRGDVTGSFDYQLTDATLLKKLVFEQAVALEAILTYTGDLNHQLNLLYPVSKLSGGMHPGVSNDLPLPDTKNFDAEYDDVTELTDIKVTIKSTEAIFE